MTIYGGNSGNPHGTPRSSAKLQFESVTKRIASSCLNKQIPGPVGSQKPFNLRISDYRVNIKMYICTCRYNMYVYIYICVCKHVYIYM